MREDCNLRYKKLKRVAWQGNSERCLVTRMLYARRLLEILDEGKRIINIDETWLPHLDFRRMSWRRRGEANSIPSRGLSQRVNMIAALDTEGRLYLSLTQQNTESDVMLMFMSRLALLLSQEDKDWRENTYWLLDNAAYHKSDEVRRHLKRLGVKIVFSGQYAYSAAVCELFFAYCKDGDWNP